MNPTEDFEQWFATPEARKAGAEHGWRGIALAAWQAAQQRVTMTLRVDASAALTALHAAGGQARINTAAQALDALDDLEASARGDEPFNYAAAPLLRNFIESTMGVKADWWDIPHDDPVVTTSST